MFPGCSHERYVEGHHVEHWADGGATKLSNLATLRRFHHRAVQERPALGVQIVPVGLQRNSCFTIIVYWRTIKSSQYMERP